MRGCLLIYVIAAVGVVGQQPVFEVASVRSAAQITPDMITSGKLHVGMKIDAERVDIGFASLRDLVMQAYGVKPFQVTAPEWMAAQRFDILAKMPEGATKEQVPAMLRALLEDRFKLVAHREIREQAVYSLEVGKNGPKFKEAPAKEVPAPDAPPKPEAKADMVIGTGDQQVRINRTGPAGEGGTQTMSMSNPETGTTKVTVGASGQMHMEMERMTMATLAQTLTPMLDRPVIDHTELKGAFTIALDLSMQDMMQMARTAGIGGAGLPFGGAPGGPGPAGLAASDPSGGSIFMSVQQLGLKLEKQKAPIETIVVDSAEKNPTEN
jgi:uncharacterized protein (TIGR03435 family)